ncbi:putative glycosyl hydrolase-like family 15 (GHL15) protein [Lentzea atacamensis]|uniref:Glycosyl hydrolase-like family 15 (GHL15) protein n=1 Tax=Lentzea atacamensis TaxID=531938 RepID=A0ABX9E2E9_9PSEU|nr:putative glycosyl hydrolase-like family 15 (GHL15) protein [Lentzea atacamensis]
MGFGVRFWRVSILVATLAVTLVPAAQAGEEGWTVKSYWLHVNSTPTNDEMIRTEAQRRSYVVLNAWEADLAAKFKAANPKIQTFVYKDLSSARSYACSNGVDDTDLPTGVGYCAADPSWFLVDQSGQRFEYDGYEGHWQMDVGNTDYQNAWVDNVIASSRGAFDGVFMDNALFACDTYHEGACPAAYPTDEAMRDAYRSMLANTRQKFVDAGLKTVANMSSARLHEGAWDSYVEHLDGGFDEWWLTFGDDDLLSEYPEGWSRQVAEIAANEAKGKITWVQPHHSGAEQPFRYAYASYLLAAGDHAAISEISQTDRYDNASPWRAEYDWDLGTPLGTYFPVAANVYQRDFTCGTVLVNANKTGSAAVNVRLSSPHTNEKGSAVRSVSLRGTSGSVLRKAC